MRTKGSVPGDVRGLCARIGSQNQAARMLKVDERTVRRWCCAGEAPQAMLDRLQELAGKSDAIVERLERLLTSIKSKPSARQRPGILLLGRALAGSLGFEEMEKLAEALEKGDA